MGALTGTKDLFKLTLPTPFPVGDVNVYLIKGDVLTLVDVGAKTEEAWQLLTEQLKNVGIAPSDIEQVIITHHHPDHVGLLDYFDNDIPVIGHPKNQPWISRDPQFFHHHDQFIKELLIQSGLDQRFLSFAANMKDTLRFSCQRSLSAEIVEGSSLYGLPEWRVIETPGHAQSHISLYREKDGLFIGGDMLLAKISPNPLLEPPQPGQYQRPKPQLQYNNSLQKLLLLEISRVVSGHGDDITEVNALIHKRLEKQKDRAYHVLNLIKERPMTAFEICQKLFPAVYKREMVLTMSETIGQLDFLEDLGEIKVDTKKEQFFYYPTE